ncbi:MAG TPA: 3-oxoacyl-[acyl-carrier-protein] reductase [Bacteroidetes bacterium]|jgi:3-oxoacyl-[acyl-carrier protein] reductase|nr:MAG: 3-ketoacyl-ACP reductase [Sphingobacteriales bacterium BACL12 MAG-120802-bin5]KRP13204.1 MAG: 3-ketoacyl-ACP reductase [Sphingobacteriales bacterium BACL12 MAG-120813-bin55]HCK22251.1 3-oxoacyl-[acyl-carrier-protein] reductase [Bacteroidota bacterium]
MKLLDQKVCLVTGASRGIGEAIAVRFAEQGANVAFTYQSSEEKAKALESRLAAMGVKAKGYRSNAGNYAEAEQLITDVLADFGGLDAVVNNAGITRDNLMLRMSEQEWDDVMAINLKSCFNITKHAIKPMMRAKKGSIINISSIVGLSGQAGQANYSASKAGIIGFTKSVAKELGSRNIRSNAIAPGFIQTDMTDELPDNLKETYFKQIPLGRFGKPEEVADVAVFLASDMAGYVNGQVLSVCGALYT